LKANGPLAALQPAPFFARHDIVRRFLAWAQRAGAEERAEAANALARAYLYSDLTPSIRAEAALAMTSLLDDPSTLVRRALAEALGGASEAPRHVIRGLAGDRSDVAAAVLQRSPVLTDADLADCAALADVVAQCAIARRPNLGPGAAAALSEIGERDAILTLLSNLSVDLPNANDATIPRSAKFLRSCGASRPRPRGRKPLVSPARRSLGSCPIASTFLPPTTTPAGR
jgi:hypothetical protein